MSNKNNPAGRLLDILNMAKRQSLSEPCRKVWAKVFQVEVEDVSLILEMLAETMNLIGRAKKDIESLENVNQALLLQPFERAEALFSRVNLDASWEQWSRLIDEKMLYGLQISDDVLARSSVLGVVSDDEIASIRAQIEDLTGKVLMSNFPEDLKLLLLKNLEALRHSLIIFKIKGLEGLDDALAQVVGSCSLRRDLILPANHAATGEDKKTFGAFFALVDGVGKVINVARNAKELSGPLIQALGQYF